MICNPRHGQIVRIRYAPSRRRFALRFHDAVGNVIVVSRRSTKECPDGPRNHLVNVDGVLVVVPCGQLIPPGGAK